MKQQFGILTFITLISLLFTGFSLAQNLTETPSKEKGSSQEYNTWLKKRFSEQHQKLIPIIAVADIFYACKY